ncbi:MAG: energy transducer TonB [Bacteroidia bacterium]|nr:energy transducer TonB [Bacteroidia bacterium]
MDNPNVVLADLDEMVFENREQGYGAYQLRKNYNSFLAIAAAIGIAFFVLVVMLPWIMALISRLSPEEETIDRNIVINMMDLPPPPSIDEVEPPPVVDVPPPIKTIEFKVPVPKPDEEIIEEVTINEMDDIKEEENIGTEDIEGEDVGYDFGEIDAVGVVEAIEAPEPDPDPNAFIMVEKEPGPVNMDNIKKLIGYPPAAKEAEIEGKVILRILVGKNGKYEKHIVVKNPHPILTKAVEAQIQNLEFTPGIQAGQPIKVWVTIPFDFKLLR